MTASYFKNIPKQNINKIYASFSKGNNSSIECIYITPPLQEGYNTRSVLKQSLTDLNLEFSF